MVVRKWEEAVCTFCKFKKNCMIAPYGMTEWRKCLDCVMEDN